MRGTFSTSMKCLPVLLLLVAVGCSRWTVIHQSPPMPGEYAAVNLPPDQLRPVFLRDCLVKNDGTEANPSQDFVKRLLGNLRRTGYFNSVELGVPPSTATDYFVVDLSVDETYGAHMGSNLAKGLALIYSFGLLSPVLPLTMDYACHAEMDIVRSDGKRRHYTAQGNGTAYFQLFSEPNMATNDCIGKVLSANINSLMNQMMKDADFLKRTD